MSEIIKEKDSKINERSLTEEEAKKYNEERFCDPVWDICRFTKRIVHPWCSWDFQRQWGMIPDLSHDGR